jgi:DNA primase
MERQRVDLKRVDIRRSICLAPEYDNPVALTCREHKDDTASLNVYRGHIVCYGCGFAIRRRMDALAYLLGITPIEAIRRAGDYLELTGLTPRKALNKAYIDLYQRTLWGVRRARLSWLLGRGLMGTTIRKFRLGHDGTRFVMPVFDAKGELVTFRFRRDDLYVPRVDPDEKEEKVRKYSGVHGRNDLRLYPEWLLPSVDLDFLVVVEGELDAIRLWQEGIPAVTCTNGAPNLHKIPALLAPYPQIKKLYVAADQDEPGEIASQLLLSTAGDAGYEAVRLSWPVSMGKDITELLLKGGAYEEEFKEALKCAA